MAIIFKANKVNLIVSSVLCVFWYHSPNVLDTPHICDISRLRVKDETQTAEFKDQFVPRSKHFPSRLKNRQLVLYGGNVAICSEKSVKLINKMWQNVHFLIVKPVGALHNQ
jgi:hypothetical protein